ncbi:MAG TPA: hypothetical protein DCS07_03305 [Bdellovibrionales bacterium]|nr:MAG: hypothetical protein A2Z97_03735 [Bdellovibrionales bacterium GWB1_52_6]OFZ06368.1 MAG: hypothetical protein A2X97_02800 [Bdellovibrionales bacterium GWA1_52_35]OFZ38282.1 MAG: hypothetical protein A2070_13375 [Bdellovibrionales bacterium GWC1_52_8]HAR41649.1 hypothetical protein [Bdellovibrionales bacterium]HCM40121.1 hypothetical protein [Bdellovibrionales bacterium]
MRLVYDYKSYRVFLKDFYLTQKRKNSSFSYAAFARQLGLSSPAHIQLILSGKRNLTIHNIHLVADALSFSINELEFFETLVHFTQAESNSEKQFYERRLQELHKDKPESSSRLKVSFLLSSGILPALLLSIEGKHKDHALSGGEPFGYSPAATKTILTQLLNEGIVTCEQNIYKLNQRHLILHDKKTRSQAQKQFLNQQLRLSVRAFDKMYNQDAKFFAHTFTIAPASFQKYQDEIKALLEKVTKLSDEESGEKVMQLNIQLFPYEKTLLS